MGPLKTAYRVADGTPLGLLAIGTATLAGRAYPDLRCGIVPLLRFTADLDALFAGIMQFINKELGYIFVPGSGVLAQYANSPVEFDNALGFFITISSLKTTVFTTVSLSTLTLMFVLFTAGRLTQNDDVLKAAGWVGIVLSFETYYSAIAMMAGKDTIGFDFPVWPYALIGKNRSVAVVTEGKVEGVSPEATVYVAGYFFQIGYIFVPSSGVLAAYANSPEELDNALGFVFLSFTIVRRDRIAPDTVVTTITLSTIAFMFILLTAGQILGFELPHWPYALMGKRTGAAGADVEAAVVTVGKHEGATEDHFLTKEWA
ncbi:hypothetical protein DFJ73DRAFT_784672 [Zopfochytrium polystomum]|nr:hypothetical protein DFJ73DRAFT_784672 [Zopfochytrium polystomum]